MRNQMGAAFLLFLLTASSAQQAAKPVFVAGGYGTAKEFNDFSASEKHAYAVGLINGLAVSGLLGADEEKLQILHSCIHPMESTQVAAILDKYIKDHPEEWHLPLAVQSYSALRGACPDLKRLH